MAQEGRTDGAPPSGAHPIPGLPKVGQEIGRFIIERELPRGGQARVFRAWQTDLQRPVALKLLPSSFATEDGALGRFRAEIENVARISHPNIVRVYEAGELEGHPFFTMEYVDGEDAETLMRRGPLDPQEAASIIEAVARAVQEAHGKGIVHRDIKPGNVILRADGTPVLTDFGLAQDLAKSQQLTHTGVSMGTPAYMAPEQARGERERVGKRSDVYALGATLFSLLTGRRPADGEAALEVMLKVARLESPPWPRALRDQIPADLVAVVEMAMQNEPQKRYESAAAFADDLERFLRGEWVEARQRGVISRTLVRMRRHAAVAAVLVLAFGLGAALIATSLDPQPFGNTPGEQYKSAKLLSNPRGENPDDAIALFKEGGPWVVTGAEPAVGPSLDRYFRAEQEQEIRLAYREPVCWGDFTIEAVVAAPTARGEVLFEFGALGDDRSETAYELALAATNRRRIELRRLGVPVCAAEITRGQPLFAQGEFVRVVFARDGEALDIEVLQADGQSLARLAFEDDFPTLVGGRKGFALRTRATSLLVRDIAVKYRENRLSSEVLLFHVGQFAEAELRLSARLAAPQGTRPEEADERARLHFLRGRCYLGLKRPDRAQDDFQRAVKLARDKSLRARVFLLTAGEEAALGRDNEAVTQLYAARTLSLDSPMLASRVYHKALELGLAPAADDAAREARLRYLDFVANNTLSDRVLISAAELASAEARFQLNPADEGARLRHQVTARNSLRRLLAPGFSELPARRARASVALFESRRAELTGEAAPGEQPAAPELLAACALMAETGADPQVSPASVRETLMTGLWLAKIEGRHDLAESWRLALVAMNSREPDEARRLADVQWLELMGLLFIEDRRSLDASVRDRRWNLLVEALRRANDQATDRRFQPLLIIAEHFAGIRAGNIEPAALRDLALWPAGRMAHASPAAFAAWVNAVLDLQLDAARRPRSVAAFEACVGAADTGLLARLRGRCSGWLPPQVRSE